MWLHLYQENVILDIFDRLCSFGLSDTESTNRIPAYAAILFEVFGCLSDTSVLFDSVDD
jgi:hypothetical protein